MFGNESLSTYFVSLTLRPLSSPTSWHTRKSRVWSVKRDEYNTMYFSKKHLALCKKFELMSVVTASAEDSIMQNICSSICHRVSAGCRTSNRAFLSEWCFSHKSAENVEVSAQLHVSFNFFSFILSPSLPSPPLFFFFFFFASSFLATDLKSKSHTNLPLA